MKTQIIPLYAILAAFLLSGCTTLNLQNRISCTVGKDKAIVSNYFGPFAISTDITKIDADAILKLCELTK